MWDFTKNMEEIQHEWFLILNVHLSKSVIILNFKIFQIDEMDKKCVWQKHSLERVVSFFNLGNSAKAILWKQCEGSSTLMILDPKILCFKCSPFEISHYFKFQSG